MTEEINIRNYYSYELLGKVSDRYVVYRDKGYTKELNFFNEYMEETQEVELFLEKKKAEVFHVMALDSVIQLLYAYGHKDSIYINLRRYDSGFGLSDSMSLRALHKRDLGKGLEAIVSEDKSKILFYTVDSEKHFRFFLFDNVRKELIWEPRVQLEDYDFKTERYSLELSNKGEVVCLISPRHLTSDNFDQLKLVVLSAMTNKSHPLIIDLNGRHRQDIYIEIDNRNRQVLLGGLYSEKRGKDLDGFFFWKKSLGRNDEEPLLNFESFSIDLAQDLKKSKKRKSKVFEDFGICQVIKRNDGGVLLLLELTREYSRRSSYSAAYDRNNYGSSMRRGWVDYYNEDMIVISIHPEGTADWSKILYKKQFSQDDEAVYSSAYAMMTPSRIRLLYNDEIKRNNTVSAYLVDPNGEVARNSLLSTEYQEMKLRFRDAVQVSATELLVPSENNYVLNMVRIRF